MRIAAARALDTVRTAEPAVIWGAEPMNGGNFLYLWATAWARRRAGGGEWRVRWKPRMEPWLAEFPALQELTVREEEVSWRQRRTVEWGQLVDRDWQFADILDFTRERLLSSASFTARLETAKPGRTVVNVRRGDYYSNPTHRANFGFDVPAFVRAAVRLLPPDPDRRFLLISDDVPWCRDNLAFLAQEGEVETLTGEHDMFTDLAQLAAAEHLVLANSTFSYWGGYLGSARPVQQRPAGVLAPLHFNRLYNHGDSPLLLPQWRAIPDDEFLPTDSGSTHG